MLCSRIIEKLLHRHKAGFDFTLERVLKLLAQLGNPQQKLNNIIHIGGTNGKGSNGAICRAILEASGARVNVYTSPHLVNWRERIRIHGKLIEEAELAALIQEVANIADENVTIFEILTVCAMLLFNKYEAEFNIFEVGLGGRLDATNVIDNPACTIISPISFDHCAILGDSLEKIAKEKAGIIKQNCPLILGHQEKESLEVLVKTAQEKNASYAIYGQDFQAYRENNQLIWQDKEQILLLTQPNLAGDHQIENAASAIKACLTLIPGLKQETINKGLKNVHWPGRLQNITQGKIKESLAHLPIDLWIDGAHNEASARTLATFFADKKLPIILIAGMLNTKDSNKFFKILAPYVVKSYNVPIKDVTNSTPASQLSTIYDHIDSLACNSLEEALEKVKNLRLKEKTIILITGSLHLVGEFLELNDTICD